MSNNKIDVINALEALKENYMAHRRGTLDSRVEEKIKENVFKICKELYCAQGLDVFQKTTNSMVNDWKQALACDIRFGREDSADKNLLKLVTMELVLSHPLLQKD